MNQLREMGSRYLVKSRAGPSTSYLNCVYLSNSTSAASIRRDFPLGRRLTVNYDTTAQAEIEKIGLHATGRSTLLKATWFNDRPACEGRITHST